MVLPGAMSPLLATAFKLRVTMGLADFAVKIKFLEPTNVCIGCVSSITIFDDLQPSSVVKTNSKISNVLIEDIFNHPLSYQFYAKGKV